MGGDPTTPNKNKIRTIVGETKRCGDTATLKPVREGCCPARQRAGAPGTHRFPGVPGVCPAGGGDAAGLSSTTAPPMRSLPRRLVRREGWAGKIMSKSVLPAPCG